MKKILLVLSALGMLVAFSSCSRDCVCKAAYKNADGDKISKSKTVEYDLSDDEKDECKDGSTDGWDKEQVTGFEYKVKCRKTMF